MSTKGSFFNLKTVLIPTVVVLLLALVAPSALHAQPGSDGEDSEYAQLVRQKNPGPARMAIVGGSQEAAKKFSKIPDDSVASLPQHVPFINEQMRTGEDASQGETRNKSIGTNQSDNVSVSVAPFMETRLMNQSEKIMTMFKDMITARIPVMGQTFFMVENGAATGYFQALNSTANLSNQITTSALAQLEFIKHGDPAAAKNYVSSVLNRYNRTSGAGGPGQGQSNDQKSVLAAIVHASGDTLKSEATQSSADAYGRVPEVPQPEDFQGEKDPKGEGSLEKAKLSEMLFDFGGKDGNGATSSDYSSEERDQLKKEFERMLGDLEIEYKKNNQNDLVRTVRTTYKSPTKGGDTAKGDNEISGPSLVQFEETGVAWEAFHRLLKGACEFVKDTEENYSDSDNGTKVGKHELLVTTDKLKGRDFENASAPDIPMNMNLINNALQLYLTHRDPEYVNCRDLELKVDQMPKKLADLNKENLDECKQNTGCLRNRLFYYLAYTIGRSRALHRYQVLYLLSKRFATTPAQEEYVEEIFDHVFGGMNLYQELAANRDRWVAANEFIGRRANAKTGGGNSMPGGNSNNVRRGASGT